MPGIVRGSNLGQAPALPVKLWNLWLDWRKDNAGAKIFLVIYLTGAFGLRCSEALALKAKDLQLNAAIPKLVVSTPSRVRPRRRRRYA